MKKLIKQIIFFLRFEQKDRSKMIPGDLWQSRRLWSTMWPASKVQINNELVTQSNIPLVQLHIEPLTGVW